MDWARFPSQEDDFHAVVMIQMRMNGGDDEVMRVMLKVGQLVAEQTDLVIVNQRERTDDAGGSGSRLFVYEIGADEVAEGF
jgi:hypothetical protein